MSIKIQSANAAKIQGVRISRDIRQLRKKGIWLIGFLVFYGCHQTLQDSRIHTRRQTPLIFIVAGQSNAASGIQGDQGPIASTTGRVIIHDQSTNFHDVPSLLKPSTGSASWIYLGDALVTSLNRDVKFFNIARGNTSTQQWIDNGWYKKIGEISNQNPVTAVIWIQGESDVSTAPPEGYRNLKFIIQESRKTNPSLVWFVALDGYTSGNAREAQQQIISERLAYKGVDIDELRKNYPEYIEPYNGGRGSEFSGIKGLKAHGMKWYEVLIQAGIGSEKGKL